MEQAHKRGRRAGPSARDKHKKTKAAPVHANTKGVPQLGKAGAPGKKAKRMQAAQQMKNKQRAETIARKRDAAKGAPRVVAVMSMHASLQAETVLNNVKNACQPLGKNHTDVYGPNHRPEFSGRSHTEATGHNNGTGIDATAARGASTNISTIDGKANATPVHSKSGNNQSKHMETVLCTAPKTKLSLLPPVRAESMGGVADWLSVAQIADVLVLCVSAEEVAPKQNKRTGGLGSRAELSGQDEDDDEMMEEDPAAGADLDGGRADGREHPGSTHHAGSAREEGNVSAGVGRLLSVWRALGLSASVAAIIGLEELPPRRRARAKASAQRLLQAYCPGDGGAKIRVVGADGKEGSAKLVRAIAEAAAGSKGPAWRGKRPSLLVESARWVGPADAVAADVSRLPRPDLAQMELEHQDGVKKSVGDPGANAGRDEGTVPMSSTAVPPASGALVVEGYVRNQALSAAQVLHIPMLGDARIRSIEVLCSAPGLSLSKGQQHTMDCDGDSPTVMAPAEELHPLDRENVDNEMQKDEEGGGGQGQGTASRKKSSKLFLPEGLADIQAAWLTEEDLQDHASSRWESGSEFEEGKSTVDMEDDENGPDEPDSEEGKLKSLKEQEEDHFAYPDEIDVKRGTVIRERFSKYRGLKSFRSSPWDPREGLPDDYSRIFAFESYARAKKFALEEMDAITGDPQRHHAVPAGSYVRVVVDGLDGTNGTAFASRISDPGVAPVVCWGLLRHECKVSLVHCSISKFAGYQEPVKNKDRLLFFNGVRLLEACPLLSVDSPSADKYKLERFLPHGQPTMASMYAPITFDPVPTVVLNGGEDPPRLVATGSGRGADPDRVVLKRVVLTGFPTKVHQNKATVRHMFYHPEDVKYYKPLELWTKYGRRGRIREPLGTHGLMKCAFDGIVQQRDTICASLYKRVFPRWPDGFRFA